MTAFRVQPLYQAKPKNIFKKKASFGATGGHAARGQGCFFFCRESFAATFASHARSQVLHRACEGAWFHVAVNIGAE